MIESLKNNSPLSIIIIPLVGIILWIKGFAGVDSTLLLSEGILYQLAVTGWSQMGWLSALVGLIAMLGICFYLQYIANENELYLKRNYLVAAIACLLYSMEPSYFYISPPLIATICILLSLNSIVSAYRLTKAFKRAFQAGAFISLACFFDASAVPFMLFGFIGLLLFRPFVWREFVIYLIGLLLPVFYYWCIGILFKVNLPNPLEVFELSFSGFVFDMSLSRIISWGIVLTLIVFAFFHHLQLHGAHKIKTKRTYSFFLWSIPLAFLSIFIGGKGDFHAFYLHAIPVFSILLAEWFLYLKRSWLANLFLAVLLLASIYHAWF